MSALSGPRGGTGRAIVQGLRSLRERAPERFVTDVVSAVGLGDAYAEVAGPIGPLFVAWSPRGITAIERAGDPGAFEDEFRARFGRRLRREARLPRALATAVERRLRGERSARLPVDLGLLSSFERRVLEKTLEIPYGEVRPYAWVASEIGQPRAVRAVGTALAHNPIPFVIPCHRVVRSDGRIGEYGAGGPEAKRAVLASEGVDAAELERLAAAGIRYIGSDTTGIFCYPSCRNARRIGAGHRVTFRGAHEPRAAGFRPCRVCRPIDAPFRAA